MKQKYMMGGLLVVMLTSCSDEKMMDNIVNVYPKEEVCITATISNKSDKSRVAFEQEGASTTHVHWELEDAVKLFTETQSNLEYKVISDENNPNVPSKLVTTTNEVLHNIEGQKVHACYPASNGSMTEISLPSTAVLNYDEDSYCPFLYGSGVTQNGELSLMFKHVFAYLKITVTENDLPFNMENKGIDAVSVTTTSKDKPLGINNGTINLVTGELQIDNPTNKVIVRKSHDLSTGSLTLYIPVLPQSYGAYIKISLLRGEGDSMSTLFTATKTMPRSVNFDEGGNWLGYKDLNFEAGNVYDLNPIESINEGVEAVITDITQNGARIVANLTYGYGSFEEPRFYFNHPYGKYNHDFDNYVLVADDTFALTMSDLTPDSTYVIYPFQSEFTAEYGNIDYFTRVIFRTSPLVYVPAEAIDLGLSVNWASHNVGTDKPEETGGVYFWGDATGTQKEWGMEKFQNSIPPINISGTEYDMASAKWKLGWRIPTEAEWNELLTECTWVAITNDSYNGYKVIGPNGNSIFLVDGLGGEYFGEGISYNKIYWTSEYESDGNVKAFATWSIDSEGGPIRTYSLGTKANIRPVCDKE